MNNITTSDFLKIIPGRRDGPIDVHSTITKTGDFRELSGVDVVVQGIKNTLLTARRTYPFDPEFGSDLYKLIFEPSDTETNMRARMEIDDAIAYYKHLATITYSVKYFSNKKGFRVNFLISYKGESKRVSIDVDETLLTTMEK